MALKTGETFTNGDYTLLVASDGVMYFGKTGSTLQTVAGMIAPSEAARITKTVARQSTEAAVEAYAAT